MRILSLILAAALSLTSTGALAQGAWGKVKSWSGSVTIEATDSIRSGGGSATMTYKATGPFTIADDVMEDGDHLMWPQAGLAIMSNPEKVRAATETWQARVVAASSARGVDEMGKPVARTCSADTPVRARVGVISSGESNYTFQVTAPKPEFKCTGATGMGVPTPNSLPASPLSLTGMRGDPRQVTNTKTFTVGTATIKVTFTMAPTK